MPSISYPEPRAQEAMRACYLSELYCLVKAEILQTSWSSQKMYHCRTLHLWMCWRCLMRFCQSCALVSFLAGCCFSPSPDLGACAWLSESAGAPSCSRCCRSPRRKRKTWNAFSERKWRRAPSRCLPPSALHPLPASPPSPPLR